MPESVIVVQRKGGDRIKGARVSLGFPFSDHPLSSGLTKSYYTNGKGEATIHHSNKGRAIIYVDGTPVGDLQAPDKAIVVV
jgi:hypothetical protein